MKKLLSIILFLLGNTLLMGQCGINAKTQNELDSFFIKYPFCNLDSLDFLFLEGSNITNLSVLTSIKHIDNISFQQTQLENLNGLNNLESSTQISFYNNPNLKDVSAINQIDSLEVLAFTFNEYIEDLSHFNFLEHLRRLGTWGNGYLNGLGAIISQDSLPNGIQLFDNNYENNLDNLLKSSETSIGILTLKNSKNIDLSGLDQVKSCQSLAFDNCENIKLDKVNFITELDFFQLSNMDIETIEEVQILPNIDSIRILHIQNVANLSSLNNILEKIRNVSSNILLNGNEDLMDISRIECLEPPTEHQFWNHLEIKNNPNLSNCETYLTCKSLLTNHENVAIENNSGNCDAEYLLSNCNPILESFLEDFEFRIIPNPSSTSLIKLEITKLNGEVKYRIFNVLGQVVKSANYTNYISIESLPSGTYFLQLTIGNNNRTEKLIVR